MPPITATPPTTNTRAVLERDLDAALRSREAYLVFKDRLVLFDDALAAAARRQADEEDVWAAFEGMDAALDAFLSTVPRA